MFPWNKQFPFDQPNFTQHFNKLNPDEVERYITHVMKNIFGGDTFPTFPFQAEYSNKTNNDQSNETPEIFETNDFVYVKCLIPKNLINKIKIQHTNHLLYLINYPKTSQEVKITLPSPVRKKGTVAKYTNGYLEVQLKKLHEQIISEVDITY